MPSAVKYASSASATVMNAGVKSVGRARCSAASFIWMVMLRTMSDLLVSSRRPSLVRRPRRIGRSAHLGPRTRWVRCWLDVPDALRLADLLAALSLDRPGDGPAAGEGDPRLRARDRDGQADGRPSPRSPACTTRPCSSTSGARRPPARRPRSSAPTTSAFASWPSVRTTPMLGSCWRSWPPSARAPACGDRASSLEP